MPAIGNTFTLISTQNVYDSVLGDATEYIYGGTESGINSIIAIFRNVPGVRYRSDKSPDRRRLIVTVPVIEGGSGPEAPTVTVDLVANRVLKDLLDTSLGQGISDDDKRKIRKAIQNAGQETAPSGLSATATTLYKWMLLGVLGQTVYQPTFRVVSVGAPGYVYPSSLAGIGQLWTTAQIQGGQVLPFTLPSSTSSADSDGFVLSWLKHHPAYVYTVGQRLVETLEWEYGKWPLELYTAYAP